MQECGQCCPCACATISHVHMAHVCRHKQHQQSWQKRIVALCLLPLCHPVRGMVVCQSHSVFFVSDRGNDNWLILYEKPVIHADQVSETGPCLSVCDQGPCGGYHVLHYVTSGVLLLLCLLSQFS